MHPEGCFCHTGDMFDDPSNCSVHFRYHNSRTDFVNNGTTYAVELRCLGGEIHWLFFGISTAKLADNTGTCRIGIDVMGCHFQIQSHAHGQTGTQPALQIALIVVDKVRVLILWAGIPIPARISRYLCYSPKIAA